MLSTASGCRLRRKYRRPTTRRVAAPALVAAGYTPQQQYNVAYAQCMNAKGAKINTAVTARYPNFPNYPYYPYSYEIYPWTTRVVCY